MIRADEITVVIQGGYYRGTTEHVVASVRKNLPGARMIYSTCDPRVPETLSICDQILVSEDPGCFVYDACRKLAPNNVNRQIINTLAALKEVQTPYVLKIRTDFCLDGDSFLKYFDCFPLVDEKYRIFQHKVLSCSFFTRNPRLEKRFPSFHPSDLALFGQTRDLMKFFDIPLMTQEEAYWRINEPGYPARYVPEQYIFINCLKKNQLPVHCTQCNDCSPLSIEQTERYFASNFVFLSYDQFNIKPLKKGFSMYSRPLSYSSCLTYVEWMQLYRKYVDASIGIPTTDKTRKMIKLLERRYRKKLKRETQRKRLCAVFQRSLISLKRLLLPFVKISR